MLSDRLRSIGSSILLDPTRPVSPKVDPPYRKSVWERLRKILQERLIGTVENVGGWTVSFNRRHSMRRSRTTLPISNLVRVLISQRTKETFTAIVSAIVMDVHSCSCTYR